VSISPLLTHCPGCESDLLQIESLHTLASETTLVERRCPECGHSEELEFASAIADVLCHHAAELAASLSDLADRLEATNELRIPDLG
jgi:peptide subunit release factor 1 (eRF1)